jgi:hypothetical protein
MMRRRSSVLGIAIGAQHARVLLSSRGRITAVAERPFESVEALRGVLTNLLNETVHESHVGRRPIAVITLGPTVAQVRCIANHTESWDVMSGDDERRDYVTRFFLAADQPTLTTWGRNPVNGAWWVASFAAKIVEQACLACQSIDIRVQAVVSTAEVLSLSMNGPAVTWIDGDMTLDVAYTSDRELASVRRRLQTASDEATRSAVAAPLDTMDGDGWRWADAYGAALSADKQCSLRLNGARLEHAGLRDRGRTRSAVAIATCVFTIAAVTPGLAAYVSARRSEQALNSLEATRRVATREIQTIAAATATLRMLDSLSTKRRSMTIALAALTHAIPDSAFVSDIRLDDLGGTIIAIGPHAAAVVKRLADRPFAQPSLVGPVTPAASADTTLERVTIRFKWAPRG